jgi:hypothetical protein
MAFMSFSSTSSIFSSSLALRCTLAWIAENNAYNRLILDQIKSTLTTFLMSLALAAKRRVPMVSSTLNAAGLKTGYDAGESNKGAVETCSKRS